MAFLWFAFETDVRYGQQVKPMRRGRL